MKQISTIMFLLSAFTAFGQVDNNSDLFLELKVQDSLLFELGFNQCDIDYLKRHISVDLRFYHDQSRVKKKW